MGVEEYSKFELSIHDNVFRTTSSLSFCKSISTTLDGKHLKSTVFVCTSRTSDAACSRYNCHPIDSFWPTPRSPIHVVNTFSTNALALSSQLKRKCAISTNAPFVKGFPFFHKTNSKLLSIPETIASSISPNQF